MNPVKLYKEQLEEVQKLSKEMRDENGKLKPEVIKEDVESLGEVVDRLEGISKKYSKKFKEVGEKVDKIKKPGNYAENAKAWKASGDFILESLKTLADEDGKIKSKEKLDKLLKFVRNLSI